MTAMWCHWHHLFCLIGVGPPYGSSPFFSQPPVLLPPKLHPAGQPPSRVASAPFPPVFTVTWGPWVPRVGVLVDRQGGTRQVQGHHQGHSVAACADLGRPSPDPQATPTGGIGLCMSPTPIMQSGEQGVATARSVPTIFAGFFAAASSTPPHISTILKCSA